MAKWRYSSTHSQPLHNMKVSVHIHAPVALTLGKCATMLHGWLHSQWRSGRKKNDLVDRCQRFGGTTYLHLQGKTDCLSTILHGVTSRKRILLRSSLVAAGNRMPVLQAVANHLLRHPNSEFLNLGLKFVYLLNPENVLCIKQMK
jgi:hypothetical protein